MRTRNGEDQPFNVLNNRNQTDDRESSSKLDARPATRALSGSIAQVADTDDD